MNMPEKYKQKLIEAHKECANIIESFGHVPEPLETAIFVEEHRWFWKPEDVKFILVGESHVYTNENEIKVKIDPNKLPREAPRSVPLNFVKFVYCLGYGEPDILTEPEKIENNPGTTQYVNLFRRCVGLYGKPRDLTRLKWKAKVLKTIKDRGIWLLDASLHACYKGRGRRLPSKLVRKVVPISWNEYVKPIIDDISINRKCVWIIGKTLHDLLSRDKYPLGLNWIYQPNARFKDPKKYVEKENRLMQLERSIKQCC